MNTSLEFKIEQWLEASRSQFGDDQELLSRCIAFQVLNNAGWHPSDFRHTTQSTPLSPAISVAKAKSVAKKKKARK